MQTVTDIGKLKEEAKIFGRGKTMKTLTNWQQEINKEAAKIAAENPLYLTNRGKLSFDYFVPLPTLYKDFY